MVVNFDILVITHEQIAYGSFFLRRYVIMMYTYFINKLKMFIYICRHI